MSILDEIRGRTKAADTGDASNEAFSCQDEPVGATGIELPEIGTYAQMAAWTHKSHDTVYRWTCRKKLKPGCYLGHGMFNFRRIKDYLEKTGSFLREK